MSRMRFGVFLPPHHLPTDYNPTYALQRDTEIVKLIDDIGFDEAWFGEHHSGGVEIINDPMLFIAHVAAQTKTIRLGTGVVSLPYHNPLWVADRLALLDHLTRGRVMLGVGPGALATDAAMIGIDPAEQRDALDVDMDVLMHLLTSDEPLSVETSRYKLVDARLQLDFYQDPHPDIAAAAVVSPSGPRIAGKHGIGLISIGATMQAGVDVLAMHWDVVEQRAAEFHKVANRDAWRIVGLMHLAETKDAALREVRTGIREFCDYLQHTAAAPQAFQDLGLTLREALDQGLADDAFRPVALRQQSGRRRERAADADQMHGPDGDPRREAGRDVAAHAQSERLTDVLRVLEIRQHGERHRR
jgi:limonene 1,2-monooxygenase